MKVEINTDKKSRVLVIGASSGIGEATARAFCAQGMTVYAAARRMDKLEKLAEETGCVRLEDAVDLSIRYVSASCSNRFLPVIACRAWLPEVPTGSNNAF